MEPDSTKSIRRRVDCLKKHIDFLTTLSCDPETINPEINRRLLLIAEAEESIRLHRERISKLEHQRDHVEELIEQAHGRLLELKKIQNRALIEKYLNDYMILLEKLEGLAQC